MKKYKISEIIGENNVEKNVNPHTQNMVNHIQQYMSEHNMSASAFAEKADMSFNTLQSILYKKKDCRVETAIAISKVLGIGMDEMLNTGSMPDATLLSIKKTRSLSEHRRLLVRRYIDLQCTMEKLEQGTKSKNVIVMNLDYVNDHLCLTDDFCTVDISDMSEDIKPLVFRGMRIPCTEYIQFYRENDILLLGAERKPRSRERCVILYFNRVFIVQRDYQDGVWGYKSIRNSEIFITEDEIDYYFGYVIAVKHG